MVYKRERVSTSGGVPPPRNPRDIDTYTVAHYVYLGLEVAARIPHMRVWLFTVFSNAKNWRYCSSMFEHALITHLLLAHCLLIVS